ncbi:Gfo/Idh/MocA family protein [Polycladidibacter stylochi]|uniref:Gfo/Idh/MocA family protein n=1 Tax=Polycladidibacter stylochi TaxID=1807766 RepID=UPI000829D589|nr:Gfo/Idh/MocA family oxidoreductase [Pseudovibrio stylochi]
MQTKLKVGIIGCGHIFDTYMRLAPLFGSIEIVACSDLNMEVARKYANEYGLKAISVEALLQDTSIDIIANLSTPRAHYDINKRSLLAGKHVFCEKPMALTKQEALELIELSEKQQRRLGIAPDTFFGGANQQARHLLDQGTLGKIIGGTCHLLNHGMESWHPNPASFFQVGGGPLFDMGPYYLSVLINLLGPVRQVAAMSSIVQKERTITSKLLYGQKIQVETPTTVNGVLEFHCGALVTLTMSWDVWETAHEPIEIYGETGTLHLPDPNFFGGDLRLTNGKTLVENLPLWDHPLSRLNETCSGDGIPVANYRCSGLADMANAITQGRAHRCSQELALHIIDIISSILQAGATREYVSLTTTCARPEPLNVDQASKLFHIDESIPA